MPWVVYFAALMAVSLLCKLIKNVCGPYGLGPHFVQKHKTTFLTTKGRNLLIARVCVANDLCLKNPVKEQSPWTIPYPTRPSSPFHTHKTGRGRPVFGAPVGRPESLYG